MGKIVGFFKWVFLKKPNGSNPANPAINHLSGCCCMWKAVFSLSYLRAATEVVKTEDTKNKKYGLYFIQ